MIFDNIERPICEPSDSVLTPAELQRYARHLSINEVGLAGQRRLKAARVLVVGAGGLGSPALMYLAAAGVGTLGVVDDDVVELSNLQRQIIHGQSTLQMAKVDSARQRIADLNPHTEVVAHRTRLSAENCEQIISQYDLVVDGSDNFTTRYLVNDACFLLGRPYVWGSVYQFHGQASVFCTPAGPCYRCLYPEPPPPQFAPSCEEGGVFGAVCASVASVQVTEAIKLIVGNGQSLAGRLWLYDGSRAVTGTKALRKDPDCELCGSNPTIDEVAEVSFACSAPTGAEPLVRTISATELADRLARRRLQQDDFALLDVREPFEWEIVRIQGAQLAPKAALLESHLHLSVEQEIILYCKGGARSEDVSRVLSRENFRVSHLLGGVLAWVSEVEPHLPGY
jgi:molybdopterin/thiamine biosynthesis adenylyltransferase/rhodanese-related sulfurtransferase